MVQISKQKIDKNLEEQMSQMFAQVLIDIPDRKQALKFLKDFLTETEYMALIKRLAVLRYLDQKKSYHDIKSEVKVSSATIANLQKNLNKPDSGLKIVLQYIRANEWADKVTNKFFNFWKK